MLTRALKAAGLLVLAWQGYKLTTVIRLKHFEVSEFEGAWPWLSVGLLQKLDAFRGRLGRSVIISPAPGSLVRIRAKDEEGDSQHFYGRAADVMLPEGPDLRAAARVAKEVGFTGIGVYPQWTPYQGLHLDVRPGPLATWGAIKEEGKQVYVSLERALSYV